jgi:hypothetical protein
MATRDITANRESGQVEELGESVIVRMSADTLLRADQLEVTLEQNKLTLTSGSESQTIALPCSVQSAGARARVREGVLILTFCKTAPPCEESVDELVTAESEQSFPASDAPSWWAGPADSEQVGEASA